MGGRKDVAAESQRMLKAMAHLGIAYGYNDKDKKDMQGLLGQMGSIQGAAQMQPQQLNSYEFRAGYYGSPGIGSPLSIQDQANAQNKNQQLSQALTPKKKEEKKGMFKYAKDYLEEHKSIVMPVVLALLADHFLLGGAFRDRLKAILSKLLAGAEKKVDQLTESKKDAA